MIGTKKNFNLVLSIISLILLIIFFSIYLLNLQLDKKFFTNEFSINDSIKINNSFEDEIYFQFEQYFDDSDENISVIEGIITSIEENRITIKVTQLDKYFEIGQEVQLLVVSNSQLYREIIVSNYIMSYDYVEIIIEDLEVGLTVGIEYDILSLEIIELDILLD